MKRIISTQLCGGVKIPYSSPDIEVMVFHLEKNFMVGTNLNPNDKPIENMGNEDDSDNWG